MICQKCNRKLPFDENILKEFVACPYCGTFFPKILPPIEAGTIEAELKKFVDDFGGLEIFSEENSSRFTKSLVKLEAPFDVARDKLLVANIKNIPQKLYSVLEQTQNEQQQMVDLCLAEMTSFGLPQKFAKETISWLAHVMGLTCDFANMKDERNSQTIRIGNQNWMPEDENAFIDERDGQKYRTVRIGNQIWMAENLNYNMDGSFNADCNEFHNNKYGRLYSQNAAQRACPHGWHLPTKQEFEELIECVGGISSAGKMLKTKNDWWIGGNGNLDKFDFSVVPVGSMLKKSATRFGIKENACFWTSTPHKTIKDFSNYYLVVRFDRNDVFFGNDPRDAREGCHSVRCIKD